MSGLKAVPAKYFAVGPYRAEQVGPKWWGVMNKNGVNVLTFPDKPGAVITDEAHAKQIADEWNGRTEPFEYAPDPYVPPVTTRMTDEEMSTYIRSRVYNWETKTWGLRRFDTSSEVYDAGFALPSYSVERDTRTWTYRDRVLTTPVTEPVEKIIFAGNEIDVLPMPKNEPSTLPRAGS